MRESRKWFLIVKGLCGFHLSYCRPFRTNHMAFYSQTKIEYLQHFDSTLVDARVLNGVKIALCVTK